MRSQKSEKSVKSVVEILVKFVRFVFRKKTKKNLCYEEQRVLEDGDSDRRDGADGTGNHAGSNQLYGSRPILKWKNGKMEKMKN